MKVLIAGDFCSRYRTKTVIDGGQYKNSLVSVVGITQQHDYSIVNLECPILKGSLTPILKQGPNLYGSEKTLDAISFMGFDCVTLANNHFFDQGDFGVVDTISALKERQIDYVGGGTDLIDASKIFYKEIDGQKLAIINCCEHEFSIATDASGGSNPLNIVRQSKDIKVAKKNADYVLIIVHGGHEHYQLPSPRMVETYRFFIDAGADAVVNHHQHCYSGYEVYHDKPIFYGLGNLFFDKEKPVFDKPWNYGFMSSINFSKNETTSQIYPYKQCAEEPNLKLLDPSAFDESLDNLNKTICDNEKLQAATDEYYRCEMSNVESFINPYQNRLVRGMVKYGILPSLFQKKWLLKMQNYIMCESHRDKLLFYLNNKKV